MPTWVTVALAVISGVMSAEFTVLLNWFNLKQRVSDLETAIDNLDEKVNQRMADSRERFDESILRAEKRAEDTHTGFTRITDRSEVHLYAIDRQLAGMTERIVNIQEKVTNIERRIYPETKDMRRDG